MEHVHERTPLLQNMSSLQGDHISIRVNNTLSSLFRFPRPPPQHALCWQNLILQEFDFQGRFANQ